MKSSGTRSRFALSRLEVFLGLAVIFGLGYMVYLFGFSQPSIINTDSGFLNETAQATLAEVAARQADLNSAIASLNTQLVEMAGKADCQNVDRLKAELMKLNTALSLLEGPLAEVVRLLPPDLKKKAEQANKK